MVLTDTGSDDVSWAGKTYREIRSIGDRDGSVAIVPVGSMEQHGLHLPVGTDTILADAAARLGAQRVQDRVPVLVTPPEWVGDSSHHMSIGGTIIADFGTLLRLLGGIVDSVVQNGFDAVLLLNGHGVNRTLIAGVVRDSSPDHYPDTELLACTYFELPDSEAIADVRASEPGGMGHGGEFETSLMLHLCPERVQGDREGTHGDRDMFGERSPVTTYRDISDVTDVGVAGDPHLATAEAGEQFYEIVGDELEELLLEVHERNA